MLFIEILNLVEIQKNPVRRGKRAELCDNIFNIGGGSVRAVELSQGAVSRFGDNPRKRGFARAGRPVKNHIRQRAGGNNIPQRHIFAEQVFLPDHILYGFRPDSVRKRGGHSSYSFTRIGKISSAVFAIYSAPYFSNSSRLPKPYNTAIQGSPARWAPSMS